MSKIEVVSNYQGDSNGLRPGELARLTGDEYDLDAVPPAASVTPVPLTRRDFLYVASRVAAGAVAAAALSGAYHYGHGNGVSEGVRKEKRDLFNVLSEAEGQAVLQADQFTNELRLNDGLTLTVYNAILEYEDAICLFPVLLGSQPVSAFNSEGRELPYGDGHLWVCISEYDDPSGPYLRAINVETSKLTSLANRPNPYYGNAVFGPDPFISVTAHIDERSGTILGNVPPIPRQYPAPIVLGDLISS